MSIELGPIQLFKIIDGQTFGHPESFALSMKHIHSTSVDDNFSAVYLQTSYEHALCYLEHKANLSTTGHLIMVQFELLTDYYKVNDEIIGRHDISSNAKAKYLKQALHIDNNELLTKSLDKPLMVLDNPDNYEVIIPHHLWNGNTVNSKVIERYIVKSKCIDGSHIAYKYAIRT